MKESWIGIKAGISTAESINKYRFAIRELDRRNQTYECYLPDPDFDDCCIHVAETSKGFIQQAIASNSGITNYLGEQGKSIDDVINEDGIAELFSIICDLADDIVEFFNLSDEDADGIQLEDVVATISTTTNEINAPNLTPMNTFFDGLLSNRNLRNCPKYLWQLKITDEEYESLKEYIRDGILGNKNPKYYQREVALYYSEFHRREYNGGARKDNAYNGLGFSDNAYVDQLHKSAKQGAIKLIKPQLYRNTDENGRTQYTYSLFYNGGLPLYRIFNDDNAEEWRSIMRKICDVEEPLEFDEDNHLIDGKVANHSEGLKEFCIQMQKAIIEKDRALLPFDCPDNDTRFSRLLEQGNEAINNIEQERPFRLQWSFDVNYNRCVVIPSYIVSGPKSFSFDSHFITNNNLSETELFSIQILEGSTIKGVSTTVKPTGISIVIATFGLTNVIVRIQMSQSFSASMIIPPIEIYSGALDLFSPQLLCRNRNGEYVMSPTSKIGEEETIIIAPVDWTIEGEIPDGINLEEEYSCVGNQVKLIFIPRHINDLCLTLQNNGSCKVFARNIAQKMLVVSNNPNTQYTQNNIFFNVGELSYYIQSLNGVRRRRVENGDISYCSDRRTNLWTAQTPLGYIYAKYNNAEEYVDPVRILNMGNSPDEFSVIPIRSNSTQCEFRIRWTNGEIDSPEATRTQNGTWLVERRKCGNPQYVDFIFTPRGCGRPFKIAIKTRFEDFVITDSKNEPISSGCFISVEQLHRYFYHIKNADATIRLRTCGLDYTYNITSNPANPNLATIHFFDNNNRQKRDWCVLSESSFDRLFGGIDELRKLLVYNPQKTKDAQLDVDIRYGDRVTRCFIKRYPYQFKKQDGAIRVYDPNDNQVTLDGPIKALSFNMDDGRVPIEIFPDENGLYVLPEVTNTWESVLLMSGAGEEVLPHSVSPNTLGERTQDENTERWHNVFYNMVEHEFPCAMINDATWKRACYWFETKNREHLIAESLYDLLVLVYDGYDKTNHKIRHIDANLLVRFVFNLLLKGISYNKNEYADYKRSLLRSLVNFANENHFLWSWIRNNTLYDAIKDNINYDLLKEYIPQWNASNGDYNLLIGNAVPNNGEQGRFMVEFYANFTEFMRELGEASFEQLISGNEQGIQSRNLLENRIRCHFNMDEMREIDALYTLGDNDEETILKYCEHNQEAVNYKRFEARAVMLIKHHQGEISLFDFNRNIRKSVLYYARHYKDAFVKLWLNKIY